MKIFQAIHYTPMCTLSSVQFSHSVMSDSLQHHELQHARLPCPSPTPRAYSNSCPLSQWCHPNHLILCHPLLLLPSIFSRIRVFSSKSVLRIRWSKYWSFSLNISPSNEHPGLISFRMDWLGRFISSYFIPYDVMVNGIVSLISLWSFIVSV